jgi:hypothetical protein
MGGVALFNPTPDFSISHSLLVAPFVKLGRMEEAKAAARRVVALKPVVRCRRLLRRPCTS